MPSGKENHNVDSLSVNSDAWNMADGYVKFKILKQLILTDKLEFIALYGAEDIDDSISNPMLLDIIVERRVEAIHRLKDVLIQVISNVRFAIRKDDEVKFEFLRDRLLLVEEMLEGVSYVIENQISHSQNLVINEFWFRKMVKEMREIKESLHFPINYAGLIFRRSDDMNFDELLKDIAEGG